ncbi:MAG: DUF4870 domain-containing protein [Flavobacteriales bacterium]|nr:DUF4870 domain-containing protein [Flavobacteriales bacterium]
MGYKEEYHPLPQPDEVTIREREDAMGAYMMMFAAMAAGLPLPIINLIAAIIYYYINKSKSKFVHFHSLHSLLAQLPTSILNAGLIFWSIRIWLFDWELSDYYIGYIWMVVIANLLYFIFSIVAAVRARRGRFFYFLFFGRYAYEVVYRVREEAKSVSFNKPPGS